ncbi:Protein of unknown function DUF674 [Cynara cardunculus var. scolymus]|uniref:Uncharacterized protein n=1 Tax=Cynara cardunculus var. scolymus TaxID=59895 RepID=A0A103XCH3_CYNCS|nr:Protein of unknown function DUF674 [Cynara cardunculus var. scolymus]
MAKKFYDCSNSYYDKLHSYVADDLTVGCPSCHKLLNRRLSYVAGSSAEKLTAEDGGFVKGVVTYMIMDDLEVKPMSTISSITVLNNFNVKEIGGLEEKLVPFGVEEGLMLLKASFECKNVLTTVFMA